MNGIELCGFVLATVLGASACASSGDPRAEDDDDGAGSGGSGGDAGGGGAGGGLGGTGGATSCDYPQGETGVLQGMLVDGALTWQGFADGSDVAASLPITDYFDCDGTRGVNALLLIQSATWCAPCQADAAQLEHKMQAGWAALGIHVLTLMVEDAGEQPATADTAAQWKSSFGLESVAVAADPEFSFRYLNIPEHIDEAVFPTQIVIDPRTMIITVRDLTDSDIGPQLEALAAANQ